MRRDSLGLFWQDLPPVKVTKPPPPKREPPSPFWLGADYLPGLQEALAFNPPVLSDSELIANAGTKHVLMMDIEIYPNYFLVAFKSLTLQKFIWFELSPDSWLDMEKFEWILRNFTIVTYNGIKYDIPMAMLALHGKTNRELKEASDAVIIMQLHIRDMLRHNGVKFIPCDHIDLIEVAPLFASLKIYGGRLHTGRMQDLPFNPHTTLTREQASIVRWYCCNDLAHTELLYNCLLEQIKLRESLSAEYGVDLRSKSDAQIAETVIAEEVARLNGERPRRPTIEPGTRYRYRIPQFITYETPLMNRLLDIVRNTDLFVGEDGAIGLPKELSNMRLQIGEMTYKMGVGGLHSTEKTIAHLATKDIEIVDKDVTSYYPQIILNQSLYPSHLGSNFLRVYGKIVARRIAAKEQGLKIVADSLKITVNGSFGKFGSMWSVLYAPDLLIQVTLTGQLALLMLIERLELRGFKVVSANTDGVVTVCPKWRRPEFDYIVQQWEHDTEFKTEETQYLSLYSRDVNNYIAVKKKQDKKTKQWMDEPDGVKAKGVYFNPWNDTKNLSERLRKNPEGMVCVDAVEKLLTAGVPIETTITQCKDITKFVSVRTVKGGAVKDTEYLGKAIRWYYAENTPGEIIYASNGHAVPKSKGARPLMQFSDQFPSDINYTHYIERTREILADIGYA